MNAQTTQTYGIIVSAGRGHRAGEGIPKQYRPLGNKTVLHHTVSAFVASGQFEQVVVVVHPDDQKYYSESLQNFDVTLVFGGAERQDSVRKGIESLQQKAKPNDILLIHDAARPLVSQKLLIDSIEAARQYHAVVPALKQVDTLKKIDSQNIIIGDIERHTTASLQTPQAFQFALIDKAHQNFIGECFSDDSSIVAALGHKVHVIEGDINNLKLTYPKDFMIAETLLAHKEQTMIPKMATGFDVHGFDEGDHVILCGCKIPHTHKLKGHSDADVAMHALTDAILGTIAAGDIGTHFPPTDQQWKGVNSEIFLKHAHQLVKEKQGRLTHIDLTIICEKPKIGPYKDAMRQQLATILDLKLHQVSVKATTTEKLGFTGRQEGIAAQAAATILINEE